jgi:hypothetical protein
MPDTADTVIWAPDDEWSYLSKHVEQFTNINKLYIVASGWTTIDIYCCTLLDNYWHLVWLLAYILASCWTINDILLPLVGQLLTYIVASCWTTWHIFLRLVGQLLTYIVASCWTTIDIYCCVLLDNYWHILLHLVGQLLTYITYILFFFVV